MRIVWSPNSLKQLESIGDYIAINSPENACKFIDKLIESVERLKKFSLSGSNVPESPNLKQVIVQGYRIIYRPRDTVIEIITVLSPFQL
ncbi:MAG: type II toxin-antitoxin system RelE/ParE family toxin [Bacteriovorax sp.]